MMFRLAPLACTTFSVLCLLLLQTGCATHDHSAQSGQAPSTQLDKEHELTLKVLDAAEAEARVLRTQEDADLQTSRQMVDFFRNFTDRCHHAKEERFYFPAYLTSEDAEQAELVRTLLQEHEQGRSILQEIEFMMQEKPADYRQLIGERWRSYVALMRSHIDKEDDELFPAADEHLDQAEERAMLAGFKHVEHQELGEGFHEKYHNLALDIIGEKHH